MMTYDKTGQGLQYSGAVSKKSSWPFPGAGAADLIKEGYRVMVAGEMLTAPSFQVFYQEWTQSVSSGTGKFVFIPSMELPGAFSPTFGELQVLRYNGCEDYVSFFQRVKNMGKWVFLTENEKKAETVIKASREAGIYLRAYGLDSEGKLRNFKPREMIKNVSQADAFALPNQISPVRRVARRDTRIPETGDAVYTSSNQLVMLGEEFLSNPQSITYQTNIKGMQAKIYQAKWLTISYFEDKAKLMLKKPVRCEGICWPVDLLRNKNGEFIGVLVPASEGYQLKQQLLSQQGLEESFPDWDRRKLTHLTKVILNKIVYLHDRNVIFGIVNTSAIFVKDENHVYFAEMDAYQIEGFPILSCEKTMQAPELQNSSEGMRLYTKPQDNYQVALLTFMLLMPGKFPYNKGKNKTLSESIKNMEFAFRYRKQGEEHGAREYFGLWRFAWSHLGNDLKQAFYYTFQGGQAFSNPEKRRDARFWLRKVSELEQELSDPYDLESLKIFPCTFKRYSGTKTIRCIKCGIDHPDFYYKYPEKRICNSCLGKPSQTHFVCKTCGKSFYYDYGTLLKYEKLVETKNFVMPTHCPYCRSDKKKCPSCGRLLPIYRFNDSGICFDCAEIERNRIVRRYYCKCGGVIELTQGEVDFYMNKFGRLPQRCKQCRENRRNGT